MPFKSFVAPAALSFGLLLSSAAAAQTMVGDQSVSEEDMAAVQAWCDDLALNERAPSADDDAASTDDDSDGSESTDSADSTDVEPDQVDNLLSGVELNSITLEQCQEAGLVDDPLPTAQ